MARPDQDAGNSTRKLIGLALPRCSNGDITPSTVQYAGTGPFESTQRGSFSVTPETGSLIAAIGMVPPRAVLEQSVCASVF
jgi:hypothetical protein